MNSKKSLIAIIAAGALAATLCACTPTPDPGPAPGEEGFSTVLSERAVQTVASTPKGKTAIPDDATEITGKITITEAGDYFVSTEISGKKITVDCAGVTIYLSGASLSNEKKVIESTYPLTITLLGENEITNTNPDGSNALDCEGDLVINGTGSLKVTSTKNAIKGNSISVVDASLEITADSDGLHAEIEAYESVETAPTPSYGTGGYVYLSNASVKINSGDEGIQADTFVYSENSTLDITSGGGAPETVTEDTAATASGAGIKAGDIDWGDSDTEISWDESLVYLKSSTTKINSNGDAISSFGEADVEGGTVNITSGNAAIRADKEINLYKTRIDVVKSFKMYVSEKVNLNI